MTQIISIMPNPGGGTRIAGDTPQEVLFFVTDGVEDETVNGSRVQSLRDPSTAPRSRIAESASPCSTRPICRCRSATLEPAARLETCNGGRRGAVAQPSKGVQSFTQPQDGGRDIFVQISAVERAGLPGLNEGQVIEYKEVTNRGKTSAKNSRSRAEDSHFSSDIGGCQLQKGSRYRLAGTIDPSISLHV
jgi:cold shock protein